MGLPYVYVGNNTPQCGHRSIFWSDGISSCLMKYIVPVPLTRPPTPCAKMPI